MREENAEIMKWWSMVVATELAQIDKDIKVRPSFEKKSAMLEIHSFQVSITAAAAADKILELEQVHRSRYHPHYIQPRLTF